MAGGALSDLRMTYKAKEAITGKLFVKKAAGGTKYLDQADTAGEAVHGAAIYDAAVGETVQVVKAGPVLMTSGAAVTEGDYVTTNAAGKVITATGSAIVAGQAFSSAGGADADIWVYLWPTLNTLAGIGEGVDNPVAGVAAGYKVARGTVTPTSAAETIVTGLTTVVRAFATFDAAPTLNHMFNEMDIGDQAGSPAAGSVILKTYKPTGAGDVTPAPTTASWVAVQWLAIGT